MASARNRLFYSSKVLIKIQANWACNDESSLRNRFMQIMFTRTSSQCTILSLKYPKFNSWLTPGKQNRPKAFSWKREGKKNAITPFETVETKRLISFCIDNASTGIKWIAVLNAKHVRCCCKSKLNNCSNLFVGNVISRGDGNKWVR